MSVSKTGLRVVLLTALVPFGAWRVTAVDAASLTPSQSRVCHSLGEVRGKYELPGLTAAIGFHDGRTIEFALGHSAGDGTRIEPGAKFLSGSIGKTFVAAVAVDLYERKQIELDAPLKDLLGSEPWYSGLPNSGTVTLRQLLTHSSGWPTHVELPAFQRAISDRIKSCRTCEFTPLEAVKMLDGAKPLFPAGQGYAYSETNYLVAAFALEKATGKQYYTLLRNRVLERLGLRDTVPSDKNRIPGLVSGEITPGSNYFSLDARATVSNGSLIYNPAFEWGGGGLASSSSDLVRWARVLYTGRAFPEPYLQDLFASVPTGVLYSRYGLGVRILNRGNEVSFGHSGSIPGYRAFERYFPAPDLAVAAQYNSDFDNDDEVFASIQSVLLRQATQEESLMSAGAGSPGVRCR